MNANETRKIMEAKIEERKQAIIKQCDNYIKNEIAPQVKKSAECGYGLCKLTKNCNIAYDYVVEKLTALGYEVEVSENYIRITW